MKWEKKEIEEIKEVLESLNKLKAIAKDKLNSTKEKLEVIKREKRTSEPV